jgi:hypothetical protein
MGLLCILQLSKFIYKNLLNYIVKLHWFKLLLWTKCWKVMPFYMTSQHFLNVRVTLRLTVSQYVLVSRPLCGRLTRYCLLFESLGMKFVVLSLWGALSDERPGLSFVRQSQSHSTVSMSWCRAHFVDVWPDIASSSRVLVWNLLSSLCGAPSLTRGRVCPL